MAGSISAFKTSFFRTDLARPSRFDVIIPVPFILIGSPLVDSRSLAYRCETAQLPGRTTATTDQKTYGPIEKFPYLATYNDIDITFYVDDDMKQKYLFDAWFDYINPRLNNNYAYKDDYATTLTINQYDVSNKKTYSVDLIEAFPISVNQLDLDWSNVDGLHKLSVTFAYTYWKNDSLFSSF
jgi:hypothetical protein